MTSSFSKVLKKISNEVAESMSDDIGCGYDLQVWVSAVSVSGMSRSVLGSAQPQIFESTSVVGQYCMMIAGPSLRG